jgi:hypothetical protein
MEVEGSFIDNCRIGVHPPFECPRYPNHLALGFSRVEFLTAEMASDTVIYTCGPKFYPGGVNINCPWVMFGISNACFRPPNSLLRNPGLSKEYEMLLTELANITQQSCRVARVKYGLQVSRSRIKNDVLIAQTWNMMAGTLTTFRYSTI